MSELRTYDVIMTPTADGPWILKSEADKVIAEKDKEIRHHKYKRCLAMAKWCKEAYWQCPEYKEKFYERWTDKWRELAEKFKPNH